MRTKAELIDIYGIESVREFKGRLQVFEQHFLQPGGSVFEWVEADQALPPAVASDPMTFQGVPIIFDEVTELEELEPDPTIIHPDGTIEGEPPITMGVDLGEESYE